MENCREVRKPKKENDQTTSTSPHVVWEGFKKNPPRSSKTTVAYSVARHDWIFKRDRILWSVKTKQKWLFGIKPSRFEEYPMTTVKYTVGSYMLWCGPIYLLEVLDILFRYMVSWILSSTNR